MQKKITLAGYVFEEREDEDGRFYILQGEYEGAFFLSIDEDEKKLSVWISVGGACCAPEVARLDDWSEKLCEGKPCMPSFDSGDICQYQETGKCAEGIAPIDKIWNEMAEDAKKQFPDWEIDQTA